MVAGLTVLRAAVISAVLCAPGLSNSASYEIGEHVTIVGANAEIIAKHEDTVYSLALKYEVGAGSFASANPDVNPSFPGEGVALTLPGQFILPAVKREGIVINLPEMRLYYFPPGGTTVHVYPVGIGRQGWETPVMSSVITSITENPVWTPPESIHREYIAAGLALPRQVEAGAANPLGKYALRIGHTSYLIHGTNNPEGVGLRVSHGCIRLYSEHIAELSSMISVDTPVRIINQPVKFGRMGNTLYVQAHEPVRQSKNQYSGDLVEFMRLAESTLTKSELDSVKRVMLQKLKNGSLYTGLAMPVR